MKYYYNNLNEKIFVVLFLCDVLAQNHSLADDEDKMEDLVPTFYTLYREAVENEGNITSLRRFSKGNKEYVVHVQKLKAVNGLKSHNLALRDKKPLIYINNPVESKIPTAFLTIDEFKASLLNRIKIQRDQFENFKKNITKGNKSSHKDNKLMKHKYIGNKKKLNKITNKNRVSSPSNITVFQDQFVNLTFEIKDMVGLSTETKSITYITEVNTEKSEITTRNKIGTTTESPDSTKYDSRLLSSDVTITTGSTMFTTVDNTKLTEIRILNNISTNATNTEVKSDIVVTSDVVTSESKKTTLPDNSMQRVTDDERKINTEIYTETTTLDLEKLTVHDNFKDVVISTIGEEEIKDEMETTTVTTAETTTKQKRPYVFLGGN